MFKIIGADLREYGPISAEQLRQWIAEGRVNAQTKVLPEGAAAWKIMAELPEFAALLPKPAPPLPGIHLGPPPLPAPTNQMALWSMITGIAALLCCQGYIGILSIVLGVVALSKLKSQPQQKGSGFAIAGIILGAIALLLFLAGLAFMLFNRQWMQNLPNAFQ